MKLRARALPAITGLQWSTKHAQASEGTISKQHLSQSELALSCNWVCQGAADVLLVWLIQASPATARLGGRKQPLCTNGKDCAAFCSDWEI